LKNSGIPQNQWWDSTQVRVVVSAEADARLALAVSVDEGTGSFVPCVKKFELPTSAGVDAAWLDAAYVGITATANPQVDDHVDVFKLAVVTAESDGHRRGLALTDALADLENAGVSVGGGDDLALLSTAERYARVEALLDTLLANFDELGHALEYSILRAEGNLDASMGKVEDAEDELAERLTRLEAELSATAANSLEDRLTTLEGTAFAKTSWSEWFTGRHAKVLDTKIEKATNKSLKRALDSHKRGVSGSFLFLIVLVLQAVGAYGAYTVHARFKASKLL